MANGLLDFFGKDYEDPRTQGLLQFGLGLMQAGGYQDRPVSLGQAFGVAGQQGMKAYQAAQEAAAKKKERESLAAQRQSQINLTNAQIAQINREAAAKKAMQDKRTAASRALATTLGVVPTRDFADSRTQYQKDISAFLAAPETDFSAVTKYITEAPKREAEMARTEAATKLDLARAEEALRGDAQKPLSTIGKILSDAGIDPQSERGQKIINAAIAEETSADTSEFDLAIFESDVKAITKKVEAADKAAGMVPQYDAVIQQIIALPEEMETTKFDEIKNSLASYFQGTGLLSQEMEEKLGKAQSLEAAMAILIPQIRPDGSGSTSNFEYEQYIKGSASFGKSKRANLIIAATARQGAIRKKLAAEMEDAYFRKNKKRLSANELERMMEEKHGSLFKTPFGEAIDTKSQDEVMMEMSNMVSQGKIKAGDVVYLGNQMPEQTVNGFTYVTQEMVDMLGAMQ